MTKLRRLVRFIILVSIVGIGALTVQYFDVPHYVVIFVLLLAVFAQHELMFDQMSMDLRMVEDTLDKHFPEETDDKDLRRTW